MLLVNCIDYTLHRLPIVTHHSQAQAEHPHVLLVWCIDHQLAGDVLCLINLAGIGQRRGIANAQRRPILAFATACKQASILLTLNLRHATLGQTRAQIGTQKVTIRIQVMRAGVGLKRTLKLLQLKVRLLGNLRHRRRGIVRDLNIVVELGGLQLRQVRIGILGKHREHQTAAVTRIVDDQCLLERHHAAIALAPLHQHAAVHVIVNAQRLQRGILKAVAEHRATHRQQHHQQWAPQRHEHHYGKHVPANREQTQLHERPQHQANQRVYKEQYGSNDKRDQTVSPSPLPAGAMRCSKATTSSPPTGSTVMCLAAMRLQITGRSASVAWRMSR